MMSRWCYVNGEFLPEDKATLPLTQTGFQRSYGIFDLFRTHNGKPRFLPDYLNRFENSQRFLGLSHIIPKEEINHAVTELQARNGLVDSTFKLVLMGDGIDHPETLFVPYFFIINKPIAAPIPNAQLKVITHEFVREFPKIKSLNYLTSYRLHQKKIAAKAGEVVYHWNGQVSEASRSNIFAIKDGTLITAEEHILNGITRKHVLNVARQIMPVEMGLSHETFLNADEVFATSTLKDVMPIIEIDQESTSGKAVFTQKIQKAFKEYINDL